jgi:hypothetical protein
METFLLAQADMMRQILQNQQQMNQRRNDQLEEDPRVATYAQFSAVKLPLFTKRRNHWMLMLGCVLLKPSWMFLPLHAPRRERLSLQQCISVVRHCYGGIISK